MKQERERLEMWLLKERCEYNIAIKNGRRETAYYTGLDVGLSSRKEIDKERRERYHCTYEHL